MSERRFLRKRRRSILQLQICSSSSLISNITKGSGSFNSTKTSKSLHSCCSPRATEPKIPIEIIPYFSAHCCLNWRIFVRYSFVVFIITYFFLYKNSKKREDNKRISLKIVYYRIAFRVSTKKNTAIPIIMTPSMP